MMRRSRISARPNVRPGNRGVQSSQESQPLQGSAGDNIQDVRTEPNETPISKPESTEKLSEVPAIVSTQVALPGKTALKLGTKGENGEASGELSSAATSLQRRKRLSATPNLFKPRVTSNPPCSSSSVTASPAPQASSTLSLVSESEDQVNKEDGPTEGLKPSGQQRISARGKVPRKQEKTGPVVSAASPSIAQDSYPALGQKQDDNTAPLPSSQSPDLQKAAYSVPDGEPSIHQNDSIHMKSSQSGVSSGTVRPSTSTAAIKTQRHLLDRERLIKERRLKELMKEEKKKERRMKKRRKCIQYDTEDRSKMTMRDLIYYLPETNPMTSSSKSEHTGNENALLPRNDIQERPQEIEEEDDFDGDDGSQPDQELVVPRVKVAEDGTLIIDEESLTVEVKRATGPTVLEDRDPIFERGSTTMYSSFRKYHYTKHWSDQETDMFFLAISMVGMDFSMIGTLFPHRDRREIKNKFIKEEKGNSWRIDKAFQEKRPYDQELFSMLLDKVLAVKKMKRQKERTQREKRPKQKAKTAAKKKKETCISDEEDELDGRTAQGDMESAEKENEDCSNVLDRNGKAEVSKKRGKRKITEEVQDTTPKKPLNGKKRRTKKAAQAKAMVSCTDSDAEPADAEPADAEPADAEPAKSTKENATKRKRVAITPKIPVKKKSRKKETCISDEEDELDESTAQEDMESAEMENEDCSNVLDRNGKAEGTKKWSKRKIAEEVQDTALKKPLNGKKRKTKKTTQAMVSCTDSDAEPAEAEAEPAEAEAEPAEAEAEPAEAEAEPADAEAEPADAEPAKSTKENATKRKRVAITPKIPAQNVGKKRVKQSLEKNTDRGGTESEESEDSCGHGPTVENKQPTLEALMRKRRRQRRLSSDESEHEVEEKSDISGVPQNFLLTPTRSGRIPKHPFDLNQAEEEEDEEIVACSASSSPHPVEWQTRRPKLNLEDTQSNGKASQPKLVTSGLSQSVDSEDDGRDDNHDEQENDQCCTNQDREHQVPALTPVDLYLPEQVASEWTMSEAEILPNESSDLLCLGLPEVPNNDNEHLNIDLTQEESLGPMEGSSERVSTTCEQMSNLSDLKTSPSLEEQRLATTTDAAVLNLAQRFVEEKNSESDCVDKDVTSEQNDKPDLCIDDQQQDEKPRDAQISDSPVKSFCQWSRSPSQSQASENKQPPVTLRSSACSTTDVVLVEMETHSFVVKPAPGNSEKEEFNRENVEQGEPSRGSDTITEVSSCGTVVQSGQRRWFPKPRPNLRPHGNLSASPPNSRQDKVTPAVDVQHTVPKETDDLGTALQEVSIKHSVEELNEQNVKDDSKQNTEDSSDDTTGPKVAQSSCLGRRRSRFPKPRPNLKQVSRTSVAVKVQDNDIRDATEIQKDFSVAPPVNESSTVQFQIGEGGPEDVEDEKTLVSCIAVTPEAGDNLATKEELHCNVTEDVTEVVPMTLDDPESEPTFILTLFPVCVDIPPPLIHEGSQSDVLLTESETHSSGSVVGTEAEVGPGNLEGHHFVISDPLLPVHDEERDLAQASVWSPIIQQVPHCDPSGRDMGQSQTHVVDTKSRSEHCTAELHVPVDQNTDKSVSKKEVLSKDKKNTRALNRRAKPNIKKQGKNSKEDKDKHKENPQQLDAPPSLPQNAQSTAVSPAVNSGSTLTDSSVELSQSSLGHLDQSLKGGPTEAAGSHVTPSNEEEVPASGLSISIPPTTEPLLRPGRKPKGFLSFMSNSSSPKSVSPRTTKSLSLRPKVNTSHTERRVTAAASPPPPTSSKTKDVPSPSQPAKGRDFLCVKTDDEEPTSVSQYFFSDIFTEVDDPQSD